MPDGGTNVSSTGIRCSADRLRERELDLALATQATWRGLAEPRPPGVPATPRVY